MSENKYRIKIETINGNNEELRAEYRMGIECQGFTIIADQGDKTDISIHKVSTLDIARSIFTHEDLLQAAIIARGLHEAKQVAMQNRSSTALGKLLGLKGGSDDD